MCQLDYEIESDGGVIYHYRVVFNKNNPKSILLKISGLDSNNTVYMSPWEFDDDHEYTEEHDLVHRNRFTKDGEPIIVNEENIKVIIKDVRDFVHKLSIELNLYKSN